jgi:hypothetical protein
MRLGELTHRVEDCLERVVAGGRQDVALMDELDNYFDRIANALEQLRRGEAMEEPGPETEPSAAATAVAQPAEREEQAQLEGAVAISPVQKVAQHLAEPTAQTVEGAEERAATAMLRVRSTSWMSWSMRRARLGAFGIEIELRGFRMDCWRRTAITCANWCAKRDSCRRTV